MNNTPFDSSNNLDGLDRTNALFDEYRLKNYIRTDRMFAVLMPLQWIVAIIFALAVSPELWAGSDMTGFQHLYAASSAEGVSQISNAARRLNELTEQLRSLTSRFKLDRSETEELATWNGSGSMFRAEDRLPAH